MAALERVVDGAYEFGALSASDAGAALYAARGWQVWPGSLAALGPHGTVALPEEEGSTYVRPGRRPLPARGRAPARLRLARRRPAVGRAGNSGPEGLNRRESPSRPQGFAGDPDQHLPGVPAPQHPEEPLHRPLEAVHHRDIGDDRTALDMRHQEVLQLLLHIAVVAHHHPFQAQALLHDVEQVARGGRRLVRRVVLGDGADPRDPPCSRSTEIAPSRWSPPTLST
ncbi:hypothetical protein SMICM17S_05446 [Streptomyces microflavus]